MKRELSDRVAIVTGGGRAIGKAIALALAGSGAHVVVCGLDEGELLTAAGEIRLIGVRSLSVVCDVSREDQVEKLCKSTLEEFGRINILVNNAGVAGPTMPAVKVSRSEWDSVLAVNLTGAFLCSKAVLPTMIAQKSGKIVNIASIAGKLAYPLRCPYAVSKWGLIGLTRTLAQEFGEQNVQINAVCPGPVRGERMQKIIATRAQELNQTAEEVERSYVQKTALRRLVEAEDVAAMVCFLASDQANNITGEALDVTAGYDL